MSTSYSLIDGFGSEHVIYSIYSDELNAINLQWSNLKAHMYNRLTLNCWVRLVSLHHITTIEYVVGLVRWFHKFAYCLKNIYLHSCSLLNTKSLISKWLSLRCWFACCFTLFCAKSKLSFNSWRTYFSWLMHSSTYWNIEFSLWRMIPALIYA